MTKEQAQIVAKSLRMQAYGVRSVQIDGVIWGVATWTSPISYRRTSQMPAAWQDALRGYEAEN
jgi:hypothetical protein